MEIREIPAGRQSDYLEGLNACFPGWGNRRTFDWAFHKSGRLPATDLLVVEEAGRLLAGSAITYRSLRFPGGAPALCATMTASWTLPHARNRGIFLAMTERSRAVARDRGCDFLNAYVRDENPSARGLQAAGAVAIPAAYMNAMPEKSDAQIPDEISPDDAWQSRTAPAQFLHYDYGKQEWLTQFRDRPWPVAMLRTRQGAIALIETGPKANRLLELTPAEPATWLPALDEIQSWIFRTGKPLSTYAVTPWLASALLERGFQARGGAIMLFVLNANLPSWQAAECWISDGDRM